MLEVQCRGREVVTNTDPDTPIVRPARSSLRGPERLRWPFAVLIVLALSVGLWVGLLRVFGII